MAASSTIRKRKTKRYWKQSMFKPGQWFSADAKARRGKLGWRYKNCFITFRSKNVAAMKRLHFHHVAILLRQGLVWLPKQRRPQNYKEWSALVIAQFGRKQGISYKVLTAERDAVNVITSIELYEASLVENPVH